MKPIPEGGEGRLATLRFRRVTIAVNILLVRRHFYLGFRLSPIGHMLARPVH